MDENNNNKQPDKWPDDEKVVYISDEEYHRFMQSLSKLEEAQKELHRLRENMN